ncbi:hypothetical protein [Dissulfuribacter thermophilus]|nr:hypothetical protein [Dissulfuribacter thermophilus]
MRTSFFLNIILVIFTLCIASCTVNPRQFLAIDTSYIHQGQPMEEVEAIMGPPDARRKIDHQREAWYYYHQRKHFYQYIPFVGSHIGKVKMEVVEVKFFSNRVEKATFYVSDIQK